MLSFSEEGEDRVEETGLSPVTLRAHVVWPHTVICLICTLACFPLLFPLPWDQLDVKKIKIIILTEYSKTFLLAFKFILYFFIIKQPYDCHQKQNNSVSEQVADDNFHLQLTLCSPGKNCSQYTGYWTLFLVTTAHQT